MDNHNIKKQNKKELNKNKTTPDLFRNKNASDNFIHKIDNIDLDKQ